MVIAAACLFLFATLSASRPHLERWTKGAFVAGAAALIGVFASLGTLFLQDQFQFAYVFNHSDSRNPTPYKIAAIWTAQEGSFLLWG
ncbi:MAG: hypothetical protein C4320_09690, partial [Armatimonadota bacterium]